LRARLALQHEIMSTIYLVRHGQGSFGTHDYDRLSPLGREQSRLVGEHFAATGEKIDRIYTGSLRRQRETAELIAEGLGSQGAALADFTVEPAFDEYDGTALLSCYASSLSLEDQARAGWPQLLADRRKFQLFLELAARAWVDGQIVSEALVPWSGFHGRIVAALERIMAHEGRGKTLAIATSGGVIGAAVAHVLGQTTHLGIELNWAVHNASLTRLIYSSNKVSLSMFNALPHLERLGRPELITYR
jgi:broad specificity phosphatase PhoE